MVFLVWGDRPLADVTASPVAGVCMHGAAVCLRLHAYLGFTNGFWRLCSRLPCSVSARVACRACGCGHLCRPWGVGACSLGSDVGAVTRGGSAEEPEESHAPAGGRPQVSGDTDALAALLAGGSDPQDGAMGPDTQLLLTQPMDDADLNVRPSSVCPLVRPSVLHGSWPHAGSVPGLICFTHGASAVDVRLSRLRPAWRLCCVTRGRRAYRSVAGAGRVCRCRRSREAALHRHRGGPGEASSSVPGPGRSAANAAARRAGLACRGGHVPDANPPEACRHPGCGCSS